MSDAPPPLVDVPTMVARVRDYGVSTTNQVVTMMMSGVFATSALAIADIMRTPDEFWLRLSLWCCISVGAIATITRQLHGNALIVQPSPLHVPLQLAVGFFVAACFAFLPLSTGGVDGWRNVYVFQLLVIGAGYMSHNLLQANTKPEYYDGALHDAVVHRLEVFRRVGWRVPAYAIPVAIAIFIVWLSKSQPWPWIAVLTGWNILAAIAAASTLRVEVQGFKTLLDDIEKVRLTAHGRNGA